MDLAYRKPLETMCHTLNLNKYFNSYTRHLSQPSWILAFSVFPAKYVQGCRPRFCSWGYIEMISTYQPFTAGNVHQNILLPWVITVN